MDTWEAATSVIVATEDPYVGGEALALLHQHTQSSLDDLTDPIERRAFRVQGEVGCARVVQRDGALQVG
jgi:hypothetical protein